MALEIVGLDHLVLRTGQLDKMLTFYIDVLGCKLVRKLSEEQGLYQLSAGSSLIDIVPYDSILGRKGGGEAHGPQRLDHFCLQISNRSETSVTEYLKKAGIESGIEFKKRYGATGFGKSVYIQDPDGNQIELKLAKQ